MGSEEATASATDVKVRCVCLLRARDRIDGDDDAPTARDALRCATRTTFRQSCVAVNNTPTTLLLHTTKNQQQTNQSKQRQTKTRCTT
jgi:hypothetical protein